MNEVVSKVILFIGLILLGYGLKKKGIFKKEDYKILSNIVFIITLPAVLITSFQEFIFRPSMIGFAVLGIVMNMLMLIVGRFVGRSRGYAVNGTYMLCCSGYNISLFVIPFVASFLDVKYLLIVAMFDIGNLIMGLGGSCILAAGLSKTKAVISKRELVKKLITNIPFLVYLIMLCMAAMKLKLPAVVYEFTAPIAKANTIIVMLMIGIIFEFQVRKGQWRDVLTVVLTRYSCAIIILGTLFWFSPLSDMHSNALKIIAFAPVTTISPILCQRMGYDYELAGKLFSVCIPISLAGTSLLALFSPFI